MTWLGRDLLLLFELTDLGLKMGELGLNDALDLSNLAENLVDSVLIEELFGEIVKDGNVSYKLRLIPVGTTMDVFLD